MVGFSRFIGLFSRSLWVSVSNIWPLYLFVVGAVFVIRAFDLGWVPVSSAGFLCQTSVVGSSQIAFRLLHLWLGLMPVARAFVVFLLSNICAASVVMSYVKMRRCALCAVVKLYQIKCVKIDHGGANAHPPLVG